MAEHDGTERGARIRPIRRILVALDASADSVAGLEAAADLAALLEAELAGLFVEDLDLVRVTLAAATEIDGLSGDLRPLRMEDLERDLRRRATRARQGLERVASRLRLRWTFRTVRGRVATELLAADADLITVGTRGHSPHRGPGSTAAEVLARALTPVLVLRRDSRLGREVYALHDGSEPAERAVAVAGEIARRRGTHLTVLVPETDPRVELPTDRGVLGELVAEGIEVRVEPLPKTEGRRLTEALKRRGCGLLVAARRTEPPGGQTLDELVRRVHCPVLVVG